MASVNFLLRSSKANDSFTARLQTTNLDKITDSNPQGFEFFESKTELYVFTPEEVLKNPFADGKKYWNKYKKYKGTDIEIKTRIVNILNEQNSIREFILSKFDESSSNINFKMNKEWLTSVIKQYYDDIKKKEDAELSSAMPKEIQWQFDNYIKLKESSVAYRTILKLKDTKNILREFEIFQSSIKGYDVNYKVDDVNPEFQYELEKFLMQNKKYSHNTTAKTIKILKTICNYAQKRGIILNQSYGLVGKPYQEKKVIYLSFTELQQIKEKELPEELESARRWLYLSCFLGQRISDFMNFTGKMIRKEKKDFFIDFTQTKTGKKLSLLLHPEVVKYLQKNKMEFPEWIDEVSYNDQIKEVCRLCGIDEIIDGSILQDVSDDISEKSIWRNVSGKFPKYKLIGSHIGRKSYCTNFYGKLPTSLILEVSGHTEERTLLSYIGKKDGTNNKLIGQFYDKIDITED